MPRIHESQPSVRDRLLQAADQLFYDEGIAIGVDAVLAKAPAGS